MNQLITMKLTSTFLSLIFFFQTSTAQKLIPFRDGNMWGYSDETGEILIKPQFDLAGEFLTPLTWVKKGDKYAYINSDGKFITRFKFDEAGYFNSGMANVSKGKRNFRINQQGKKTKQLGIPSCGIGRKVHFHTYHDPIKDKIGRIKYKLTDEGRSWVKERPLWDAIKENYDGLAAVQQNGKWRIMNLDYEFISDYKYDDIDFCTSSSNGLLKIAVNGKYGFSNKDEEQVIKPIYMNADCFSSANIAKVWITKEYWGYIDETGKEFFTRK